MHIAFVHKDFCCEDTNKNSSYGNYNELIMFVTVLQHADTFCDIKIVNRSTACSLETDFKLHSRVHNNQQRS
jgi:hypothetical protein